MQKREITYNDGIVRQFLFASVGWGIVGMLVGLVVALQLPFWQANVSPYLSFGRLRPLHTNAVIFAFVGNMIFAGVYYSLQRLTKARMASDLLSKIHFWGWQLIIVSAAITLPLGLTQGKEYAELIWPIDIAIAVIWIVFSINFFWTLQQRREKQLYVSIWFYIATLVTITVLHIVNNLAIPTSFVHSYPIFGGVQDALVQWWYGHNAVAFFLTTPILGIMYYFLPKAAERPVFSYRLSIVHFWGLVFLYIWAGPHHLLYTALPEWVQTLGMIFSLMLWAPSWGGMVNGLLTLRGAWNKLRDDPVLKFFAAGITFYGMATFEGPMLAIKSVNGLAHYTDWIIGHVHSGTLGWNGFMAAGMFYWLAPRLYGTKLYNKAAANLHFWIGTMGILLYVASMWIAGITQGLMWRAVHPQGGLEYTFLQTVLALRPLYWTRLVGGLLYFSGFVMMAWNLIKTARSGKAVDGTVEVVEATDPLASQTAPEAASEQSWTKLVFGTPVLVSAVIIVLVLAIAFVGPIPSIVLIGLAVAIGIAGIFRIFLKQDEPGKPKWHPLLEGRGLAFTILTLAAILVGGIAEIVPTIVATPEQVTSSEHQPYSALAVAGRDIYIREGCYTCHSQMIRPFLWETDRYGDVSRADESMYDHPFQWGSRRIGPDLAREGGRRGDLWHFRHFMDPRAITEGSNMPPYAHLGSETIDFEAIPGKMRALRTVGVPYTSEQIADAETRARTTASQIAAGLSNDGVHVEGNRRILALIAFIQRLGRDDSPSWEPTEAVATAQTEEMH